MTLHSIAADYRPTGGAVCPVYVLRCGSGVSCLGFDVAERRRRAVLEWLGEAVADMETGTPEHFAAYESAMARGRAHNAATGARCPAELTPQLVGLEGARVEVDGRRFWVGRSTGWLPVHLEISSRNSTGGPAAYVPPGVAVRVVRRH